MNPGDPMREPVLDPDAKSEVADELAFHVDMRTRELVAQGMTPEAARRAAVERFQDLPQVSRECTDLAQQRSTQLRRARYIANLQQDIGFALRMLRHRLSFAALAILPLALGIGAATAMYSVVDGIMLRPLPFAHPERLVAIWAVEGKWKDQIASPIAWQSVVIGQSDYIALRERARTLAAVAAWGRGGGILVEGSSQEMVNSVRVTASLFPLLGIRPVLGRTIQPGEDVEGGPQVALMSWEMWQQHFGGDSSVVGRSVTFEEKPLTIVGIMPPDTRLDRTVPPPALWSPAFQGADDEPARHNRSYRGLGRLASNATVEQASAEVANIIASVKSDWKGSTDGTSGRAASWQSDQVGSIRPSLLILAGAVLLLLLIACVNVATLMFGEAARREPEIAARTALGATPGRLARQLLTESVVIAGCSAVVGLAIAWLLTHLLVSLAPPKITGLSDVRIDARVFAFTAVCAVMTGIAFGLLPTFALLRWGRASSARSGGGQTSRGEQRIQRSLVAIEVALCLVMLVGCSLLGRSLKRVTSVDPGFGAAGLLDVQLSFPRHFYADSAALVGYYDNAIRAVAALPGVTSVTAASGALFRGMGSSSPITIVGRSHDDDGLPIQQRVVRSDYFHTTQVPIVAGRGFTPDDRLGNQRVAVISAAEVRREFANQSPLGQRVRWQGQEWTIVGVAADVHYALLTKEVEPTIYIPDGQWSGNGLGLIIRTSGDGTTLIKGIRQRLAQVNPAVTASAIDPVTTLIQRSYAEERYRTLLGSLFGVLGSILAGVGMFGVISRTVSRRMREAGIRVALGAQVASLTRLMLRDTAIGALIGVAIGLPAAIWLAHLLTPYLFGIHATDPLAFGAALVLLAVAVLLATIPPAQRAGRVDPVSVLRGD